MQIGPVPIAHGFKPRKTAMRPKVKFLVTVWGDSYIEQFATFALPSFLAPGNLPALNKVTDLEVIILTSAGSVSIFSQKASFQQLGRICDVRFIEIDDLITSGAYGVTLTLAYARGVMESGNDMANTYFVFMNSDFVLADGSLSNLAKYILDGQSVVVAPSFRATSEELEPRLLTFVDQLSMALTISARRLVSLALGHMHPTTIAKIVNQDFCHSVEPNQFFWQVDDQTILGRFYLIFMLCLKPERVISKINSFCDYGFIPQFCPSRNMILMDDSDEFFMLELSKRTQENFLLRPGRQSVHEIAQSLSNWTTREHRLSAEHNLVFHAEDIPAETEKFKTCAETFITDISKHLKEPMSHEYHNYWLTGINHWQRLRREKNRSDLPPEIEDHPRMRTHQYKKTHIRLLNWLHPLLGGTIPNLRPWHYAWHDFRVLKEHLRRILSQKETRILFISDGQSPLEHVFPLEDSRIFRINIRHFLSRSYQWKSDEHAEFTYVFCYLPRRELLSLRRIFEQVLPHIAKNGEMISFVRDNAPEYMFRNFSRELMDNIAYILPTCMYATSVSFSGGFIKHSIRIYISRLAAFFYRYKLKSLFLVVPAVAVLCILSILNNLYQVIAGRDNRYVNYCSSFLIRVTL